MEKSTLFRGIFLLLGIVVFSCARNIETEPAQTGQNEFLPGQEVMTFTAILQPGSKTQMNEDFTVLWSEGDKIRVFNAENPAGVEFSLTEGAGTASGTFSAAGSGMGSGPFYGVYPSDAASAINGTAVSVRLPDTQVYADGSFGPKANLAAGKADELDQIRFFNLLGAVSFTLTGSGSIADIRLRAQGTAPLSGEGTIDGWDAEAPTLSMKDGQADDSFRVLSLDCGEGVPVTAEGKTFYLTAPAGTLAQGFTFQADDTGGYSMIQYAGAAEGNRMEQNVLLQMPALAFDPAYKTAFLNTAEIGAFTNILASAKGAMTACCLYTEGKSQYAYLNTTGESGSRYIRLQDWTNGYLLAVKTPYELQEGLSYSNVTVTATGNTGSVTSGDGLTMKAVKMDGGRIWLADSVSGIGYILMMED